MSEKDDERLPYEPPQVVSEKILGPSSVAEELLDELLEDAVRASDPEKLQALVDERDRAIWACPPNGRKTPPPRKLDNTILGVPHPDTPCMPWLDQILSRLDESTRGMRALAERAVRSSEVAASLARDTRKDLEEALETIVTQRLRIRELELQVNFLRETTVPRSGIKDIPDYTPSRAGNFRSEVKIYVQGDED